jgi:hypothetical protein
MRMYNVFYVNCLRKAFINSLPKQVKLKKQLIKINSYFK